MRIRKRKNRSSLPPEVLGTDQTNASHASDRDSSNNTGVSTPYGGLQPTLGKIQLAPDTTDWAELHGDRAVKLAIGLGWQVAIIYLSTLTPTLALEENSSGHNQSLPPRNLISKTIKSRTTSLALSESGASKNWVSSLSKLLDSDYEDASEARHLAQELHLGLVESLTSTGKDMRPAYELGRLLSEAVLLATGTETAERPRVYRQLFNPLRLLPMAEWLASLEDLLPLGSAKAVFTSLQNWSRWISSAADDDFGTADEALREQARIWRDLLLGRVLLKDLPSEENFDIDNGRIKANNASSITDNLADISLSAAFNNRSSANAGTNRDRTIDMGGERQFAFRATRLPKHRSPAPSPDNDQSPSFEEIPPNQPEIADIDDRISQGSDVSDDKTMDSFHPPDHEAYFGPRDDGTHSAQYPQDDLLVASEEDGLTHRLSISRYSLGVQDFISPPSPETAAEGEYVDKSAPQFQNDITSLAGSLDETAENSWLSKFTKSSVDMIFDPADSVDIPPTTWDSPPPENLPEPQHHILEGDFDQGLQGKRHPGFDLDVYENFDFDFAPGFAPGFDPANTTGDWSQDISVNGANIPESRGDKTGGRTHAAEPDLLPFDINLLQNFNINEAKPTFLPREENNSGQNLSQGKNDNLYGNHIYDDRSMTPVGKSVSHEKAPFSSRRRIKLLGFLFAIVVLLFAARTFVVTPVQVTGNQVPPLITAGEWVLVSKLSSSYIQGNIVYVTKNTGNITDSYFARIIALPGQAITSSDNEIYVNGTLINTKPWYGQLAQSCGKKNVPLVPQEVVAQSHYVVMMSCEGSSNSENVISDITSNEISGKVISVIWENSHPWFHWF